MTRVGWLAGVALAASAYAAADKPFVDCDRSELVRAAPELSTLEFDSDQTALNPLLRAMGQQLKNMLAKFVNVSIAEDAHEMRFDGAHMMWAERREKCRYVAQTAPAAEFRRPALPDVKSGFVVAGHFLEALNDLLPENQKQGRFRYLGRMAENGARSLVVAFTAPGDARQGLAWVDETTKRIVRLRSDVMKREEGVAFESFSKDIRFVPVNFAALDATPWLPASAVVHVKFATGEMHSVHRFSDYRVDGFEHDTDANQLKEDTGEAVSASAELGEDGIEILLKGLADLEAKKPGEAAASFREAAGRLAERVEPGYYIGLALHGSHDLAAAEGQFRETVKRAPGFAEAHNALGVVLFERGDAAGALAEFRETVKLEPANASARANLDDATKRMGERKTAAVAAPPPPAGGEVTIKVDVRQVLVPVVVTDKEGHHVIGLTQGDFTVFEDGVEQKISAFASERADVAAKETVAAPAGPPDAAAETAAGAKPLAKRHAYIICVDTMHASFGNFVHVREALQKLFQQEAPGDSQYAVIGLGRTMEIIQNTTSDPAKVLEALGGTGFRKTFLASQTTSVRFEMEQYERTLQEVRALCDSRDPTCDSRKRTLPSDANRIAEYARMSLVQFLAQFRSIVDQLARGRGRRTLVLLSDGFLTTPGKTAYTMLEAYFPDLRSMRGYDSMHADMEPIFRIATQGNVPIYTIDSRGLYTSPSFDVSRGGTSAAVQPHADGALNDAATEEGMTLSEIAAATGGTAFHYSNDILTGLKRAFADGREYYMLAYVPSNETQDGKFRKIEVRVREKKALVSAKRGYWATAQ